MSRGQLLLIAVLSLACTAVVLAAGTPHRPAPVTATRLAAARRPLVVRAAAPPAARPAASVSTTPAPVVAPVPAAAPAAPVAAEVPTPAASAASAPAKTETPAEKPAQPAGPTPSKAGHVFVIALTGTSYDEAFGATSPAPYLATTLAPRGVTLSAFRPLDAAALPNYVAMTGGQPPNDATRAECATFAEFPPGAKVQDDGTVAGSGCVYPNTVITIGDQLTSSRRSWHAYLGGMGDQPCRHPASDGPDDTAQPGATYATRTNPFVYFHSLLDLGDCVSDDVDLSRLDGDLQSAAKTPSYSYIAPGPCASGTELVCADAFLREWVPKIQNSPAYRKDGAIVVAFLSSATAGGAAPPATGALVLSRFATPGKKLATPCDPYSLLRSLDDFFGLDPLGRAQETTSFAKAAVPTAF